VEAMPSVKKALAKVSPWALREVDRLNENPYKTGGKHRQRYFYSIMSVSVWVLLKSFFTLFLQAIFRDFCDKSSFIGNFSMKTCFAYDTFSNSGFVDTHL